MANTLNAAFNSLNNDTSSATYENNIAQNFNLSSEELNYDNDSYLTIPSSKYITQFQLKDVVKNFSKDTFSLLHINIRSISKHFDDLQILLDSQSNHSFSVIGLTETWLSSDTNLPYAIDGYDLIVNNRSKKSGGGVALDLSNCLEFTVLNELNFMNEFIESLFVEISIPHSKNIIVGIIYRPPNSNSNDFF